LCGLIFSRGAVRKDFILELSYSNNFNFLFSIIFFFSVFITFGYRYRLWSRLILNFNNPFRYFRNSFLINFLSFILVRLSVVFIWWSGGNLFLLPSFYLYLDFFTPLLYMFLMFILIYFFFVVLLKELVYKFNVDFYPKLIVKYILNFKFLDLFLISLVSKGFSMFSMGTYIGGGWIVGLNFNNLVVLFFLLIFFM